MIEPKKSRIQFLRETVAVAESSGNRTTYDIPFRGEMKPMTKIKIRTDFPLYNIKSGRTAVAQTAYIEQHGLRKDFFKDPEDPAVQKAQHSILLRLIGDRDLDKDLVERRQREPVIVTCDGFIVDGNRRVAALRQRGEEYVTAVVLPSDADKLDIYDTELERQMARETKAPFNWIAQLLNIRRGLSKELNTNLDHLAQRMRRKREVLKGDLTRLTMVDMYLDWIGAPGQFHKVPEETEQAFTDLTERLEGRITKRLTGPAKDAIRRACFATIERQEGEYQRIRDIINQMGSKPRAVLEKLKEDPESASHIPPFAKRPSKRTAKKKSGKDPMSELADEETATTTEEFQFLSEVFAKPEVAKKVVPALLRATEELEEERKETKRRTEPLQLVEKAAKSLEKVDLSAGTKGIEKIAKALSRVEQQVERLTKQVSAIGKDRR